MTTYKENQKHEHGEIIIEEIIEFFGIAQDAESENRALGLADLKFVSGEQWPPELVNSRQLESRPCLTINKLDAFCRTVENQQRQQRPRMKVHPTNGTATKKIADVINGLCRHIEVNSSADTAYDTAFSSALRVGWGYIRITTDYVKEDSFDQDIYINAVDNPFSIYFDPDSVLADGSDGRKCLVTTMMPKDVFRSKYPKADDGSSFNLRGAGDNMTQWIGKEDIRIAEYYYIEDKPAKLVILSDKSTFYKDELPDEKILAIRGLEIVDERDSYKRVVRWCKVTALEVLEEGVWNGRYIPIVPVYGNIVYIDGKRKLFGMVRYAKDPQRMVNYWETAATEAIALAPKAKWIMAEGQDEGHENEWARANISATPYLRYAQTDSDGQPAPAPQRLQPEPPPVGIMEALQTATGNMREVLGIVDPATRDIGNMSGKALNAERMQSDQSTFHYYDNLQRSIQHVGRIILDLIPKIYDTERVTRIITDEGIPDVITLNGKQTTAEGEVLENNMSVGEYDVVMDTGPGYNSKRMEALDAMSPMMQNPEIMKVIGDLYFRNSDFPGAEVIADRLASVNPLANIDEKSDVPPQAQMQIKQMQQQLQQAQQQMQAMEQELKTREGIERMKQDAETQREHMRTTVKAHDTEEKVKAQKFDTQSRVHGQMAVEEIKAHLALLLAKMDGAEEREADEQAIDRAI